MRQRLTTFAVFHHHHFAPVNRRLEVALPVNKCSVAPRLERELYVQQQELQTLGNAECLIHLGPQRAHRLAQKRHVLSLKM